MVIDRVFEGASIDVSNFQIRREIKKSEGGKEQKSGTFLCGCTF